MIFKFAHNESGNTFMIFALALLPIVMLLGIAYDTSRLQSSQNHLNNALDAAALAAAQSLGLGEMTETMIRENAVDLFKVDMRSANSKLDCAEPVLEFDKVNYTVKVTANCNLPTTFSGIVGKETFGLTEQASARASKTHLDLMMMLDVSGSMQGDKLTALQSAAHGAIDTLINDSTGDRVRIGLAPYSYAVNAGMFGSLATGDSADGDGWTGNTGTTGNTGPCNNGNGNGHGYGNCNNGNNGNNGNGNGNNGNGQGNQGNNGNGNNGNATTTTATTLDPDQGVGGDGLIYDKVCASERIGLGATSGDAPGGGKWVGKDASQCPDNLVIPLTTDTNILHSRVDELVAEGSTAGHLGVAWSWYMVSPDWADILPDDSEPRPYDDKVGVKAVILMTDGEFNTEYEAALGDSATQSRKLCTNMKNEGVIVFAVAFDAPLAGKTVLKNCASSETQHYFEATDAASLAAAYAAIASQLNNLRLTD